VNRDIRRNNLRCLVTVADDFGKSGAINRAIDEASDSGILTAASLMAGGEAFEDALRVARQRKGLSIGLHVTLCDGFAVLPHSRIPDLVSGDGSFEKNPVRAWLKYSRPALLPQVRMEIGAQLDRLEDAGVRVTHVDCHHHLHMHPFILEILCREAAQRGIAWVRMPREPLPVILSTRSPLRGAMPFVEWATFGTLGIYNYRAIRKHGLHVAERVYGLSRTGDVDEKYLMGIIERAVGPVTEIFFHPDASAETGRRELEALTSPRVKERLSALGVTLAGYRDLGAKVTCPDFLWEGH
jgi:hopanoid biosynthesis associated protein HpnK